MYLKSLTIKNFRKYGEEDNVILFTDSESYESGDEGINVASTVSLIVGKNNAGKTTVIEALKRILKDSSKMSADDFNYNYLSCLCNSYKSEGINEKSSLPYIELKLVIGLEKSTSDGIGNLSEFLSISGTMDDEVIIVARYEVIEEELLKNALMEELDEEEKKDKFDVYRIKKIIKDNSNWFALKFYDVNENEKRNYKADKLITFVPILVKDIESGSALNKAFNKIVKYRYEHTFQADKEKVDKQLDEMNVSLTTDIEKVHTKDINDALSNILSGDYVQVSLNADITFEKLMENLIKYEFVENDNHIPENQFGLGYASLIMIIASIIDYIEKAPESAFNGKLNIISIEEPECHMHPQMQELFINYINDAINKLLESKQKNPHCQIIITTHSSHIVNSKVHYGKSFNIINYLSNKPNGNSYAVSITDDKVKPDVNQQEQFTFIKKHMKFGISDSLFADALIIVEGLTEEVLIPYYVSKDELLKHKYIKVVRIDGAHAYVYHNLLRTIGIPVAIITDMDIVRSEEEKKNNMFVCDPTDKVSSNNTIKWYAKQVCGKDVEKISDLNRLQHLEYENVSVFYQLQSDNGMYRTSFEEDFINRNYNNVLVNDVLANMRPLVYKKIIGDERNYLKNKEEAYRWQRTLSDSKGDFASNIMYSILVNEDNELTELPNMPDYIADALDYIGNNI